MIDLTGIKNIIFDYGGVIINIDFKLTIDAFKKLGFENVEEVIFNARGSALLSQMEKGTISHQSFYDEIRTLSGEDLTDNEIKTAWNALLLDMPTHRIRTLEKLRSSYHIFLLSNTNSIHFDQYSKQLKDEFGYNSFDELFHKAWFSFQLGLTKPNEDIFYFVIDNYGFNPDETLFIDDLEANIQAAINVGMKGYHLKPGEEIAEIFN